MPNELFGINIIIDLHTIDPHSEVKITCLFHRDEMINPS